MEIFIVIFSWLIFGGSSAYFAQGRGRDPFAWFLIGLLLGILSLLVLFLLPPLNKEEIVHEVQKKEHPHQLKDWYYLNEQNQQVGPNSFNQIKKAEETGKICGDTLVWFEGLDNWTSMKDI